MSSSAVTSGTASRPSASAAGWASPPSSSGDDAGHRPRTGRMSGSDGTASAVRYDRDADGIVVLTLDDPAADVNLLNDAYRESMAVAVDRLERERDDGTGVTGVVVTSAKDT